MLKKIFKISAIIIFSAIMFKFTNDYKNILSQKKFVKGYFNNPTNYHYISKGVLEIPKIGLKNGLEKADDDYHNLDYSLVYQDELNFNHNIIIFGHSGTGFGTYFSRLGELNKGDFVIIYHEDKYARYKLYEVKKIKETDLSVLEDHKNNDLILITCLKNDDKLRLVLYFSQINVKK